MRFIVAVFSILLLTSAVVMDSHFVWLDWDHNAPSDNVEFYTLYMGTAPNTYTAAIDLGYQNSIQVIKNHPITYCRVTATNATGESLLSNQVSFTNP